MNSFMLYVMYLALTNRSLDKIRPFFFNMYIHVHLFTYTARTGIAIESFFTELRAYEAYDRVGMLAKFVSM